MAHRRIQRLNEQLKREIALTLQSEVRDPRVRHLTVTAVETSPDLGQARVFVTTLAAEEERKQVMAGARAAAAFVRGLLAQRLRLRRVPELHFEFDDTLAHALRIEQLLAEIHRPPGGEPDDEG
jgi:ribosome-binding factor A